MKCVGVLLVALAAAAVSGFQYTEEWEAWKEEHGRVYESDAIEHRRHAIWERKMQFINEHNANADEIEFTVEMNKFGDLEANEITQMYKGYLRHDASDDIDNSTFMSESEELEPLWLPRRVDWRRRGAVTHVKDQGGCGACYAFSATGALEGQYEIKTRRLVSFSEQQIVDCSEKFGNRGCHGGRPTFSFKYLKHIKGGIQSERSYPYRAQDQRCRYRRYRAVAQCTGFRNIRRGSEWHLKRAVARIGPISVTIDSNHTSFEHYERGLYNEPRCSSRLNKLDHVVLVVGYGYHYGRPYWLIKNSWGRNWGMNGYMMMSRNKHNQCGIATKASYPIIRPL